jgi:DNA repair protein RadC
MGIGAERENLTMHRNQATLFETLNHSVDATTTNRNLVGPAGNNRKRTADPQGAQYLEKYVPIYHIELVRDRMIEAGARPSIHNSDAVVAILRDELLNADREKLVCLTLNAKNIVIGINIVSVGTLTASLASGREIFKSAILVNAAAIILSHNHISGDPTPSREDIQLTERIRHAGEILGIRLLDHIIISEHRSYSFANAGRLR